MNLTPLSLVELQRWRSLQPFVQRQYIRFREAAAASGWLLALVSATRTFDEQAGLYAQGRTHPGPKVTNARPGQSWHNFGLAFDVAIRTRNSLDWTIPPELARIGEACGFEWGGRWRAFRDENHFQLLPADANTLTAASRRWPRGWKSA